MPADECKKKPELILITDEFPYSYKEASFLRPELEALAERFHVTLVSKSSNPDRVLSVRNDIRVLHYARPGKAAHLACFPQLPFNADFREELRRIFSEKAPHPFLNVLLSAWFISDAVLFGRWMKKAGLLGRETADLYYSYWNNYALYALASAKRKGTLGGAVLVGRTHGYDLYPQRQPFGRQPMKQQTDRHLTRMYCISEQGLRFYKEHFDVRKTPGSTVLFRLGTPDRGLSAVREGPLRLLSLSHCVTVKRISLIIEALAHIPDTEVQWTHYGDGPLLETLRSEAAEKLGTMPNIVYSLPGAVENEELMRRLPGEGFDLLLNVSSSEGVPVSCMEALSMGIPVIATDVGGTRELVNASCGILLRADPGPEEIAGTLKRFCRLSAEERDHLRKGARTRWKALCGTDCFRAFGDDLMSLLPPSTRG